MPLGTWPEMILLVKRKSWQFGLKLLILYQAFLHSLLFLPTVPWIHVFLLRHCTCTGLPGLNSHVPICYPADKEGVVFSCNVYCNMYTHFLSFCFCLFVSFSESKHKPGKIDLTFESKHLFPLVLSGLEITFFSQEQFCSWVQNIRSKFGLTWSWKCIYYENGPKGEGANLLLSYFFRSKCPRTSRKLHLCDCKFGALGAIQYAI